MFEKIIKLLTSFVAFGRFKRICVSTKLYFINYYYINIINHELLLRER